MKEVFIVSESEDVFSMFTSQLAHLPVHFSWLGDMDKAEKQFRVEKPDFVFFAVRKLTLLHNWIARYKSYKLKTPYLCFIPKTNWEKRELLWMAGTAEVVELPKLTKEFRHIVESVLVPKTDGKQEDHLAGSLALLNIINLIETFESGKKNGIVTLSSRNRTGQLFFYKGNLVNAEYNKHNAMEAVLAMALWRDGSYTVSLDKTRHSHKIKEPNGLIVKACQDHILEYEVLISRLPDHEKTWYAAPMLDYEQIGARLRKNVLFFKFGRSISSFMEQNPDDSFEFLKEIDHLIENATLIESDEYQKQQLRLKELKNTSGVKKLIHKIFQKEDKENKPAAASKKPQQKLTAVKKGHLFDAYTSLEEFLDILEKKTT